VCARASEYFIIFYNREIKRICLPFLVALLFWFSFIVAAGKHLVLLSTTKYSLEQRDTEKNGCTLTVVFADVFGIPQVRYRIERPYPADVAHFARAEILRLLQH